MDRGAACYERYLAGQESAFDEIMELLFHRLVFFIDRYVQDPYEAEDLAIETMTELVVHPKKYRFTVSLKTYLFLIGKSKAIDYLRRKNRRRTEPAEAVRESADRGESPEEQLQLQEQQRMVHEALAKLPQEMSAVLHLLYFEDLTYEEAAKIMKKSPKQVDNLAYRGKKELRQILGKEAIVL
ncbi:MAG: RNA polymerase sigma factor [Oscillospiraceae bacterium]|nr:RNA polymerase sigma factor [Oscillospiraceae bacterium]